MRNPAPRRVFMTADAIGGVWTYAIDLASGLAAVGVEVTLAILGPSPTAAQLRQVEAAGRIRVLEAGAAPDWLEDDPGRFEATGRKLAGMAERSSAELVHLNNPAFASSGFVAPVVGACHSCLATWWDAVRGADAMPPSFRWRTERLREGYGACAALIAPSKAFAAATARRYGVAPAVVPNGRARRSRAAASRDRFVFAAGRFWDEAKNLAALDAAAALMRGRVEAAGPLRGLGGEAAADPKAVMPLGSLDAAGMADRFDRAAVFASLARYEPFGLGVLEAAQAGCALVLSDVPTFRELWDGAASFVDPDDAQGTAATLDHLLDDPQGCARLGALAEARSQRFTVDAMVEGTLAVYRSVVPQALPREAAA